jgi:hypothetical protein
MIEIVSLVTASLSMSVHFGTWLTEQPMRRTTSGRVFTEVHQGRDAIAARVMPILGNAAIVLIGVTAISVRDHSLSLVAALVALALYVADVGITPSKNVPLNKGVQSWSADAPPAHWSSVRDRWEHFHSVRTVLIVSGFFAVVAAVVASDA